MATPSRGTGFSDGVRGGDLRAPTFDQGAPGAPYGMIFPFVITPEAPSATNLRAAAAVAGAGSLALTAGAGITLSTSTYPGYTAYEFDVARCLTFVTAGPTTSAVDMTISGWDMYGVPTVETVTVAAGAATTNGKKAFAAVHTIQASGASGGGTISIGTSSIFGLPYRMTNASFIHPSWNGVPDYTVNPAGAVMSFAGTFTAAVDTAPTAATGDVRGTYAPNAGVAADGAKILNVLLTLYEIDPIYHRGERVTSESVYGQTQFSTGWL